VVLPDFGFTGITLVVQKLDCAASLLTHYGILFLPGVVLVVSLVF
jgi:hypothetical protein